MAIRLPGSNITFSMAIRLPTMKEISSPLLPITAMV
jgi:hypothetical protein